MKQYIYYNKQWKLNILYIWIYENKTSTLSLCEHENIVENRPLTVGDIDL
jgi:hypothetical protein